MDMGAMTQTVTLYGIHITPHLNTAPNSWWLMYGLMAVFALGPWLGLLADKPKS
jgi:hypothetical protein